MNLSDQNVVILTNNEFIKFVDLRNYINLIINTYPLDGSNPVITINSGGNGSTIRGLTITEGSYGIYMDSVSNCNITGNNISYNFNGIHLTNSTNSSITGNTITDTGVGITYRDSNNTTITGNNITRSQIQDIQIIDTTGIVMSTTTYNCGPATLATVLQNLGINVSQDVLVVIAGTDEDGTTMYGLAQAAQQQQGVFVKGLKLTVNELKPRNIVYLLIEGTGHYSIITSINNTIVYLADTDLGNINMTIDDFTAAYVQNATTGYGYALIVTNDSNDSQLSNNNTINEENMKVIKGTGRTTRYWDWIARNKMGYNKYNSYIKYWAGQIKRGSLIYYTAKNIFNYVYKKVVTIPLTWIPNTTATVGMVAKSHQANCVETARIVSCIAQAMGIPNYRIRIVHRFGHDGYAGHYWVQIHCGKNLNDWRWWKDLDCSHAYDKVDAFTDFVEQDGQHGNPMLTGVVREYFRVTDPIS